MGLLMATRAASTFSGPRMTFCRCSTGRSTPALHRLEKRGRVVSKWEAAPDHNREFEYYRLTDKGQKTTCGRRIAMEADGRSCRIMWPAAEES
ncbi:MAG: helix-turn-helix transcriptional regulator [Candidatus Sulfotelmatobacter sp.]